METIKYIRVEPNHAAQIMVSSITDMNAMIGIRPGDILGDNFTKYAFGNQIILSNKKAGEFDLPFNRYVRLAPDQFVLIPGSFVILNENENGYCSLTQEEINFYMTTFMRPHKFIVIGSKLFIFEIRSETEMNLIRALDIQQKDQSENE